VKYDLGIGEPHFLQSVCDSLTCELNPKNKIKNRGYPTHGGEPELVEAISQYQPEFKYKVVCNGAKQALYAAIAAINRFNDFDSVVTPTPFWNYLTPITYRSGVRLIRKFEPEDVGNQAIRLLTSPNNPDGKQYVGKYDIWDAAYAHSVYGFDKTKPPTCKVSVWSGSKLFGISHARIGWLATDDKDLAIAATKYVEETTSGVSRPAQAYLLNLLNNYAEDSIRAEAEDAYEKAKSHLKANAKIVYDALRDRIQYGNILTHGGFTIKKTFEQPKGMFAWVKARDHLAFTQALKGAEIGTIPGVKFGMEEDGWHRISLGQTKACTEQAMEAFVRCY